MRIVPYLVCTLLLSSFCFQPCVSFAQDEKVAQDQFIEAARKGDVEQVKAALAAGIDVDSKTEYGATALFFACDRGYETIVDVLLESGADPNAKDTFYKATPLTWAQQKGHYKIVGKLLAKGGEGADKQLMSAVASANVEFTQIVLDSGAVSDQAMQRAKQVADTKDNEALSALFASLELPDSEPAFAPTAEDLKRYLGKYKQGGNTVSIEQQDDQIKIRFGEAQFFDLQPVAKDEFLLNGSTLKFVMDGESVKEMVLNAAQEMRFAPVPNADETAKPKEPQPDPKETSTEWKPSSEASKLADLAVSSANWPSFRGTGARGIADGQGIPIQWDVEAQENFLWKTPIAGLGLSSPVIWGDRLYITSAVSEDADSSLKIGLYGDVESVEEDNVYEFQVLCLDKNSGDVLWNRTAATKKPAVKRHAKSSHANPTTATDGNYVVAFFGSEGLYCYDMDGNLQWQKELGFLDSGWFYDPGYQWGFAGSPVLFEDLVIVQCDIQKESFVAAYNVKNGEQVWRTPREEIPTWSSPIVHEFDGLPMLITGGTKAARGYDARTGELLWSLKEHSEIVVPTPFVAHDLIYLASGYSPIRPIYAVRPEARGDISLEDDTTTNEFVAWSRSQGGPYMPTPIVYGDYLYCCNNGGILRCYEATTGVQVYQQRMRAPDGSLAFTASPIAGDGHLYFTAEDGRVLVVLAGPTYKLVGVNKAGESTLATPAASANAIFLRTQDSVIAVGK